MRKVSIIVKSQATSQFRQKKKEVIINQLKKTCKDQKQFQEYLDMYAAW